MMVIFGTASMGSLRHYGIGIDELIQWEIGGE